MQVPGRIKEIEVDFQSEALTSLLNRLPERGISLGSDRYIGYQLPVKPHVCPHVLLGNRIGPGKRPVLLRHDDAYGDHTVGDEWPIVPFGGMSGPFAIATQPAASQQADEQ